MEEDVSYSTGRGCILHYLKRIELAVPEEKEDVAHITGRRCGLYYWKWIAPTLLQKGLAYSTGIGCNSQYWNRM